MTNVLRISLLYLVRVRATYCLPCCTKGNSINSLIVLCHILKHYIYSYTLDGDLLLTKLGEITCITLYNGWKRKGKGVRHHTNKGESIISLPEKRIIRKRKKTCANFNFILDDASLRKDFGMCERIMTKKHHFPVSMLDGMNNTVSSIELKVMALDTRVKALEEKVHLEPSIVGRIFHTLLI